jgi:hypothetical protein
MCSIRHRPRPRPASNEIQSFYSEREEAKMTPTSHSWVDVKQGTCAQALGASFRLYPLVDVTLNYTSKAACPSSRQNNHSIFIPLSVTRFRDSSNTCRAS